MLCCASQISIEPTETSSKLKQRCLDGALRARTDRHNLQQGNTVNSGEPSYADQACEHLAQGDVRSAACVVMVHKVMPVLERSHAIQQLLSG